MKPLRLDKTVTCRDSLSIKAYLREIAPEEMLTAPEEVELAKRIKQGDQTALEKLTLANQKFLVSVAKQYQGNGMGLNDLINEGNIGLIKAAQEFDETRGFRFISYAVWWIRKSIMKALGEHSRTIKLPMNKVDSLLKIQKALLVLEQDFEREPTDEELFDLLNEDNRTQTPIKLETVTEVRLASQKVAQLDRPFSEEGEDTLYEVLENKSSERADASMMLESSNIYTKAALDKLTEKQRKVIELYFGIGTDDPRTIEEISKELIISKERVRQLKEAGINRLRREYTRAQLHKIVNYN